MGVYGPRGTLGLIVPPRTNETLLYEMMRIAPEGVDWCLSSLGLREHDLDEYERALAMVETCAQELVARGVHAIAFAGIPLETAPGPHYHVELAARIRSVVPPDLPVATDLGAMLAAVQALGVRRVTVISNYQAAVLDRLLEALRASGLEVAAARGLHLTLAEQITQATFDTAYDMAMSAYEAQPATDAFFFACPQWPLVGSLQRLEAATGLPGVAQLPAIVWWAMRALGMPETVPDRGRLLSTHGSYP
jgi:maleate cis-trans isomerase